MSEIRQRRRLAAILAADVVGYTSAMAADEAGTLARLQAMVREVIAPAVEGQDGRIFKEMGDAVLAEFPSSVGAAHCAAAIQTALAASDSTLALRIGLHVGDVIVEGNDLFGDGVNIAMRLQAEAQSGGVVVSDSFRNHAEGRAGLTFDDLGTRQLKNVAEPMRLYQLRRDGGPGSEGIAHRSRRLVIAGAVLTVVAAVAIWTGLEFLTSSPPRASGPPTVAVLPFDNLSPDPKQAFFAEGLAEDLTIDLSKLNGIQVISRTSSFAVDRQLAEAEIASRLNADHIVTGSVRRAGDQLRITANLIDPEDDTPLWAERFDGADADIFAFQDRITAEIIGALKVQLTPTERQAVATRGTDNPAAYDAYLRGLRAISARRRLDTEAVTSAQGAFEYAIQLDPGYAQAYAGIAWTKWLYVESVNVFNWETDSTAAFELAAKSIALEDNALAHRVLARRYFTLMTYWASTIPKVDLALQELQSARRLQPNDPDVLADLAIVLNFAGRPDEALALIRKAMERNPNHPDWYFAPSGIALLLTGEQERAVEDLTRWAESMTSWNVPHLFRASALALSGHTAEANLALARFEFLSNTLAPAQYESLKHAEREGADNLNKPLEIRTTFYAIRRKWPMQPREQEIFFNGLRLAGMTETPG